MDSRGRKFYAGVDIGGTFTDVVLAEHNSRNLYTSKKLTTPADPSRGVIAALRDALDQAGAQPAAVERVVHATTLATNVILERKGAKVAYLGTKGFPDTVSTGGEWREEADRYDLLYEKPPPLVPGRRTAEIDERINFRGEVLLPLDEQQAASEVGRLAADGVEAFAVCFLHAYVNPSHEEKMADIVRQHMPGAYVALSSEVWPQIGEVSRASTTMISAYVGPVMALYVERLGQELKQLGVTGSFQIMQSNGGVMSAETAARRPVYSIESGPAAGVIVATYLGRLLGEGNLISFDMGGTTAKAGVIRNGQPSIVHDFHVGGRTSAGATRSGYLVKAPVIDLAEVGAGGGSIAWVDSGGGLQVGPQSAGADPGPACYGFGGDQPTVTDANLLLGYLNPDYFLGGAMRIYPEKSRDVIERLVARPLKLDVMEAAAGIYEIVNANMASAIRIVTVQRGIDPRGFSLIAFGGAWPAHIVKVAEIFDIPAVIVPITPGLTSAFGLLVSDMTHDYVRTRLSDQDTADIAEINALFQEMEDLGVTRMEADGIPRERVVFHRQVDVRYRFQGAELTVPLGPGTLRHHDLEVAINSFKDIYHEIYGTRHKIPTQLVNFRLRVVGTVPKAEMARGESSGGDPQRARKGARQVFFKDSGGFVSTDVYDRMLLRPGDLLVRPAVVEEPDSTTIIPPGYHARVDPWRSLVIRRGPAPGPELR